MIENVSVVFGVTKPVFEQVVLNPQLQYGEICRGFAICSYLQERLELSIETYMSDEEFLTYWDLITRLRVIKISDIFKIPLTNDRKVCLRDVQAWNKNLCTLNDEDKYPLLKAILDISIQKFENLVMK